MLQRKDEKNATLSTSVTRSIREVDDTRTLWRDVYCKEFGWLGPDADPSEDPYHDRSYYAVCRVDGSYPVGTLRIVHEADRGFYITKKLGRQPIEPYTSAGIEIQRLMVRKEFRDRRMPEAPFGVYGALVKACLHHALTVGADWVLADCHKSPSENWD
jgi:hypothetical protein